MNFLLVPLLSISLVLIQCLIGGTRLVFSYPTYALIGLTAAATLFFIGKSGPKPSTVCIVSALLLAGYVFARALFSPVPYLARSDAFMVVACLLVYLITAVYLHSSRARLWVVCILMGLAVVHVTVGLIQFREQNGFMLFGFIKGLQSQRASGLLICPNHFAGFLEVIGIMALSLTAWSRFGFGSKLLTGYIAVFCYLGVILSVSRGGYLSATFSLLAFALFSLWIIGIYRRRDFTLSLLIVLLGGAVLLGGTAYVMTHNSFINGRLATLSKSTKDARVYNWQATLDQFKEAPVFGTGAGTHLYYGRQFRRRQIQADPIHSHNDYLEMLAEYGVVGELLLAGFLLTHLLYGMSTIGTLTVRRLCNSLVSSRSDSLALCVGATTGVLAIVAHSVVDFNMHIPGNALLLAFLFGIIANPGTERTIHPRSWASAELLLRTGMVLAGVALIAAVAFRYRGEAWTEKARVALRDNNYKSCLEKAEAAIKADNTNPCTFLYQGEAYRVMATRMPLASLRTVLFEKAVNSYQKGLAIFPRDETLWVRLGQAYDGSYQFDKAREAYLSALQLDPNLGMIHAYYGTHLFLTGQAEEAKKERAIAGRLGTTQAHTVGMSEAQSILDFDPANAKEN